VVLFFYPTYLNRVCYERDIKIPLGIFSLYVIFSVCGLYAIFSDVAYNNSMHLLDLFLLAVFLTLSPFPDFLFCCCLPVLLPLL
jgi:hypothetical protein